MMRPHRHNPALKPTLAGVFVLALLLAPVASAKKKFSEVTTVVSVEVPVQVLENGEPVRGLTRDDFEILDGRKVQPITGFEMIDLSLTGAADGGRAPLVAEVPVSARRHFLLLFDLTFSDPARIVLARQAAMELVEKALHPTDLVAVSTYAISQGAKLVLGFTSDRRQVSVAIQTLGLPNPLQKVADPLGLALVDASDIGSSVFSEGAGGGERGANQDIFLENLRDMSGLSGRAARDQRRNQVLAMTSSMTELAELMRSAQGRKHVVFLSEGFDSSVLLGTAGNTNAERERIAEINENAAAGEFWLVDSDERYGSSSAQQNLTQMVEEFRRADCAIQAVDIGGARAGAENVAKGQDGLYIMANETGGSLIRNFNDLSEAMGEVLEDTSVTYLLAFEPSDLKADGEYHKIKVRLKSGGKGMRLVHRPGYFAPVPADQVSPQERQLQTAGLVMGGSDGGDFDSAVLAASFRSFDERAYVPVLIEIDGPSMLLGFAGSTLPTEIYAYAIDSRGNIKDFFTQALALDLDKVGGSLRQGGFKFWGHFDLDPGDYVVRVVVRNGGAGTSSVSSHEVTVAATSGSAPALLPPLFPEPQGKWLMGKEQSDDVEVAYPFQLGGQPFIPAAKPVIPQGGQTQFYVMGYNLPAGDLPLSMRLYDALGEPATGAEVALGERLLEESGVDSVTGTFRAGSLSPGRYDLELTFEDPATGETLTSRLPIVVGG